MPILSINFDIHNTSACFVKDSGEVGYYSYDYGYCPSVFAHFTNEKQYFTELLDFFVKKLKVTKTNLSIIATGFPSIPTTGYEYQNTVSTEVLLGNDAKYYTYFLNKCTIITRNDFTTYHKRNYTNLEVADIEHLYNRSAYGFIKDADNDQIKLQLSNLFEMKTILDQRNKNNDEENKQILFIGSLLNDNLASKDNKPINQTYLYMLSMLKGSVLYELFVSAKDKYLHYLNVKKYDAQAQINEESLLPKHLCTLINSPGETVCLLKTEIGTQQLLEIGPEEIVVIPCDQQQTVDVLLKNAVLGDKEYKIKGGKLGLVIDTRNKQDLSIFTSEKVEQDVQKYFSIFDDSIKRLQ